MVEIFSWEGLVVMRLQSSAQSSVTLFFAVQISDLQGIVFFLCDQAHLMHWSHWFGFNVPFYQLNPSHELYIVLIIILQ